MPNFTPHFNWALPIVGGDANTWGDNPGGLNFNISSQDTLIRAAINSFIGNNPPSVGQTGTLWLNNTTNPYELNIYDGASWVLVGTLNTATHNFIATASNNAIGDFKISAQTADHAGWLLCNGQSVSQATYSSLFGVIGTSYGGEGGNFNVPNMQGQVAGAIGTGPYPGATTRTVTGTTIGEETHVLTVDELAKHQHFIQGNLTPSTSGGVIGGGAPSLAGNNATVFFGTGTSYTGTSAAHNNMQPTLFVGNYFIYSGV